MKYAMRLYTNVVLPDLHPGDPEPAEIQQAKASKRDLDNASTFLFATAAAQKSAKRLVARTADAAASAAVSRVTSPRMLAVPDTQRVGRVPSTGDEERLVGVLEHKHRLARTNRCTYTWVSVRAQNCNASAGTACHCA